MFANILLLRLAPTSLLKNDAFMYDTFLVTVCTYVCNVSKHRMKQLEVTSQTFLVII